MSDFKAGDTVRCIETWTTRVVDNGCEYTVEDVRHRVASPEIFVNDQWVPVGYFELVAAGDPATLAARLRRVEALAVMWEGWAAMRSTTRIDAFRDAAEALRDALDPDEKGAP